MHIALHWVTTTGTLKGTAWNYALAGWHNAALKPCISSVFTKLLSMYIRLVPVGLVLTYVPKLPHVCTIIQNSSLDVTESVYENNVIVGLGRVTCQGFPSMFLGLIKA